MTSHAPGPWQSRDDYTSDGFITIIANVGGEYVDGSPRYTYDVIACCEDEFGERLPNVAANVRLIIAAPELLQMCEGMLPRNLCLTNSNIGNDTIVPMDVTMGHLRAIARLIAKAKGVTS